MEKIIKEIKNMSDKKVIQAMLEKVILGQESRDELVEVFTSMAAELGVEKSVPTPDPEPEPEDDEKKSSFFKN
jgi:hypothetical protein|tara:strand:+ start:2555 stop:2773 length:219 start_codon:yes stop_codon:yes gene_type:complete